MIRVSRLPLLWQCAAPAHVARGALLIDEVHEAANTGTAAHELLAGLARTGDIDWAAVADIAKRHGADPDEVRMLAAMGRKLWEQVKDSFPSALTEVPLHAQIGDVLLTGHADLISIVELTGRAADWKTGRLDSNYTPQLQGYAALTLLDNPELTECTSTALWVRDQEIENYTMGRDGLASWIAEFEQRVVRWDGVYRPGPHCRYCPCSHECAAANALARRDVAAMLDATVGAELAKMSPAEIVDLAQKASSVAGIADRVRKAIKAHVQEHGDVQANGHRLTIEQRPKRVLRPAEAWRVLTAAGFEDEDFAACMTLSVTKTEKRIAKKAGKGKGAAAVRTLGEELKKADAIETKATATLAIKRA